jgi:Ca-activated chloride channel family protein
MTPASDEAALFTFDTRLREETPFTNDPDIIRAAAAKTIAWGQTSLYDAIGETARRLAERPAARQAVIVVTDGLDTRSSLKPEDVSRAASSVDVPGYIVVVAPKRGWFGRGNSGLADLARSTGGDHIEAATPEQAATRIAALLAELRQQYFLAIEASTTPGWHRLEVRTKGDLKVRARSGYTSAAK